MNTPRVVAAEVLDHLAPDDPSAQQSRRDLVRLHLAMGSRSILCRGWRSLLAPQRSGLPMRVLELGAGDGTLLLGVAHDLAGQWPRVQLTLLDRQDIVAPKTIARFAALGWSVKVQVADVMGWATPPEAIPSGHQSARWDLISTTLFLHHFERCDIERLLRAVASRTDRFFACEPRRSWLALAGSRLVGAIGANAVTQEDAVLSVQAGFRGRELSALWPQADPRWELQEAATGLFSHCFSARRIGAAP